MWHVVLVEEIWSIGYERPDLEVVSRGLALARVHGNIDGGCFDGKGKVVVN